MTRPYYQDQAVTLYHGDALELLPLLALEPDLIVTDPPYGDTELAWDVWPPDWPSLMPGRSMWCFGSMRMFLDRRDEFAGWRLSQDVVWEKHNGSGFRNDRFRRLHEHALFWYRGRWADCHHEAQTRPAVRPRRELRNGTPAHTGSRGKPTGTKYVVGEGAPALMGSVIFARSMNGTALNETEKPVGILEPLIAYGCPAGGLVLDPFAGSTSTLIAARNIGRRAIGIEMREQQCEAAALRLSQGVLTFGDAS